MSSNTTRSVPGAIVDAYPSCHIEYASDLTSSTPSQTSPTETYQDTATQVPQLPSTENRIADSESLYAPSTTSTKTSFSSRFGSFSKLPLISRTRPSSATSSSTAGSSAASDTTFHTRSSKSRGDGDKNGLIGTIFRKSKAEGSKGKAKRSQEDQEETDQVAEGQEQRKVRDPVKTVPSGKAPAVTYADLAYRYGAPSAPGFRRL